MRPGRCWSARRALATQTATTQPDVLPASAATFQEDSALRGSGLLDALERAKEARRKALTGAWRINVAKSETGFDPFNAYHTFGLDGTFVEVSDLLATLTESPAHGAWNLNGQDYLLTFELFVFDEQKKPAGIVRVRCSIRLTNPGELAGDAVVDFIAPDGSIAMAIDRTPFTGKKIQVLPAN